MTEHEDTSTSPAPQHDEADHEDEPAREVAEQLPEEVPAGEGGDGDGAAGEDG